jgi:hypothetical protein
LPGGAAGDGRRRAMCAISVNASRHDTETRRRH